MNEPLITWVRLFDGRLWHIQDTPDVTRCGRPIESVNSRRAERLDGAPPGNGWVCDRCVRAVHDIATIALQVWRGDPRRHGTDTLPAPTTTEETN